jgi:hypothetical protein
MDIVPPPAVRAADTSAEPVEEEPNQPSNIPTDQPETPQAHPVSKTKEKKQQQPGPEADKQRTTAPVAAITMAVLAFIVLAALAYFAYSKR